ncbi:hypothetical protein ACA910_000212 [Epithemia clementina (nom. ined.)]
MSSWLLGGGSSPKDSSTGRCGGAANTVQDLVQHLYPQSSSTISPVVENSAGNNSSRTGIFWSSGGRSSSSTSRLPGSAGTGVTRFSTLLLEHGEQAIQDWAVVAYSAPWKAGLLAAANAASSKMMQNNNNASSGGAGGSASSGANNNSSTTTPSNPSSSSATTTSQIQWAQSPQYPPVRKSATSVLSGSSPASQTSASTNRMGRTPGYSTQLSSSSTSPMIRSVADIRKDEYPTIHMTNISGRLYLCSRSLVFEPDDVSRAVIRCPWSRMDGEHGITSPTNSGGEAAQNCIQIHTTRHIVMKVNNVLGPFESINLATKFRFCFLHSSPRPMMELARRLYHATESRSGGSAGGGGGGGANIDAAEVELQHYQKQQQQSQLQQAPLFDMDNLVDVVREQLLVPPIPVKILTPLQSQRGVLVVTSAERLYFQPSYFHIGSDPSSSSRPFQPRAVRWKCSDIVATARRYHGLRDSALEIYWNTAASLNRSSSRRRKETNNNIACSSLIAFERRHDREQVLRLLPLTTPCLTDREFLSKVVQEWLQGNLSNYDYLLALNSAAGRSFHDLSRYPVFPWVLADYTSEELDLDNPKIYRDFSKPIGALSPSRLEYFQQRLASMQDLESDPFLYGTHYSAPAYVLYYLVRTMPEHMLCLQNGKFDAADRMFYSVSHCFQCCLTNHADVKELIPQFFSLDKFDLDFLRNARSLSLGVTQTGERVHDVILPPWARDSPRKFVQMNRDALESVYCTQQLPAWIDLIFGVSSRGEPAKLANNLFHRMAYLGPRELADASPAERATAELQATEFGIVPDQLFQQAHPLPWKYKTQDGAKAKENEKEDVEMMESLLAPDIGRASSTSSKGEGAGREAWELLDPPSNVSEAGDSAIAVSAQTTTTPHGEGSRQSSLDLGNPADGFANESSKRNLPLRGTGEASRLDGSSNPFDTPEARLNMQQQQHGPSNATPQIDDTGMPQQHQQEQASDMDSLGPRTRAIWDMKMLERRLMHNDAVSGCVLLLVNPSDKAQVDSPQIAEANDDDEDDDQSSSSKKKRSLLATTSLDGGLMVHKVSLNKSAPSAYNDRAVATNPFSSTFTRFSYSSILSRNTNVAAPASPSGHAGGSTGGSGQSKLTEYRTHSSRDPLASLVVTSDGASGHVAFAGGHDDVVLAYGINSACAVASVYSHRDAVTGLDLIPRKESAAGSKQTSTSALWLDNATHILISGSWDATVKVWSASVSTGETVAIQREPLAELFDADSSIVSVSACAVRNDGIVIAAGCVDGSFCVWNIHDDGVQVVVHKEPSGRRGSGPCSAVQWVRTTDSAGQERLHLFCAFSTGKVASYSLVEGSSRLTFSAAVGMGVAILSMVYSEEGGFLLVGCFDGGLRLVPVTARRGSGPDGSHNAIGYFFDSKPTLWKAVNNKAAPGICSISIAYTTAPAKPNEAVGRRRCICCTGGEDGSVALFELKLAPPTKNT